MIENTLLSTQQSRNEGVEPSSTNSPTQSPGGMSLSGIPVFTRSKITQTPDSELSFSPPLSYDDGKVVFEYEFTCVYTDSRPMYIHLYDVDDLSALQRVTAQVMDREEITYHKETGIGFFQTLDGLRWCFKKQPYKKSIGPHNGIEAGGEEESPKRKAQTADDILAGL